MINGDRKAYKIIHFAREHAEIYKIMASIAWQK